ncbi:hypothetical protein [Catenulispora subtropica]|uniref:Twin-arginine translocation signal domain-containing protein n=1 Tax=Catenulispora subtropica TaxID=450798 RepID=A0ABP5CQA1_9ACTN
MALSRRAFVRTAVSTAVSATPRRRDSTTDSADVVQFDDTGTADHLWRVIR